MNSKFLLSIVLAEDELTLLNHSLKLIASLDDCYQIVGSAYNGIDAWELVKLHRPAVVITDIRMPMMDGLSLIKQIQEQFPEIIVIVISGFDDFQYAQQAIRLGVNDYLLKPLDEEELKPILRKIKVNLENQFYLKQETELQQALTYHSLSTQFPLLEDTQFYVLLVHFGPLSRYALVNSPALLYQTFWKQIQTDHNMDIILSNNSEWWLIDHAYNTRFLIIQISPDAPIDIMTISNLLLEYYINLTNSHLVSICVEKQPISCSNLWQTAQNLTDYLDKSLILGRSKIYCEQETLNEMTSTTSLLDAYDYNRFVSVIRNENGETLRQELQLYFEKWMEHERPQKWIEKKIGHLMEILQANATAVSEEELSHLEFEAIHTWVHSSDIADAIKAIILMLESSFFDYDRNEYEHTQELTDLMEQYMIRHFSSPLSMDDIARHFKYNGIYLSRIFKKYKGVTPIKYVISLRINEAIRLMQTRTDLNLKAIAEIVGYPDQSYFNRIFKSVTGKSPSFYELK